MSTQALNFVSVQSGLKDILFNQAGLYETRRQAQDVGIVAEMRIRVEVDHRPWLPPVSVVDAVDTQLGMLGTRWKI